VAPAEVREAHLRRHAVRKLDRGRAFALSTGLGPPRAWQEATGAVLAGFEEGLEGGRDAGAKERLQQAYDAARESLVTYCNSLIERAIPSATLVALVLDHEGVHVLSVGTGRVYLHRTGSPQRLTPRNASQEGLIDGTAATTVSRLEPGDLLLAGSASAFSTASVGRVASVLQSDANTPPSVLVNLLTDPARKAGVGGVALALRVR